MASFSLITILFLSLLSATTLAQPPPAFKCTTKSTCMSLIGYKPINTTTLGQIQSLFQVKTLRTILGVNNLPLSTSKNYVVSNNRTVTIPFPCRCSNGTGLSNRVPQYTIQKNDGLFFIANTVFSGLVAYKQIQAVNHIKDANLIIAGQKLWIPLPCSCDADVDGTPTIHYGHVVADRSSVDKIAEEFGTTPQKLMSVNGINDPKKLIAGQVLDVPRRACSSSVNSSSPDSPLLVANGTYVFTANNCVMCKCAPMNNFTLECHPSGLKAMNWATCPAAQCPGGLLLGNTTTSSDCQSTCAYAGYNKQTILANLVQDSTCAAPAPEGSNGVSTIRLRGWSLGLALLCIHLLLLQRFL